MKKPSTLIIFIANRARKGGSYINGGVMDDPKTSIDLDQDQSNRAIFKGRERQILSRV